MHEIEPLIAALAGHRPKRRRLRRRLKRAAVAAILRETRQGVEVLLVQRARRSGDPWSGDMALPGGRIDGVDAASASRAACRETEEETGLRLTRRSGIGRLSDRLTLDHRRRAPMIVSPFVYRAPADTGIRANHEIAGTHWLPLARLDENGHRDILHWRIGGLTVRMLCHDCGEGRRLWGLTLAILDELVALGR